MVTWETMHIRDVILPEDTEFFDLFDAMAGIILEAAEHLVRIAHDPPSGREACHRIRQLEHEGDSVTRQIHERLDQSLITPLEPEEIARLAPALDDVLDAIDWVSHQLCNYGIEQENPSIREFADLILSSAKTIQQGLSLMRSMKDTVAIQRASIELNRLWNRSSDLLSRSVLDLFGSRDPIMIIKFKDVYESMEGVMEKCNDLGHVLNDIAIAHR
jgi:uncharacterized protein Yka (UPF0111/DUF47 family)